MADHSVGVNLSFTSRTGVYARVDTAQRLKGRFIKRDDAAGQAELAKVNRTRALEMQALLVASIKQRTLRKQVSTGRLVRVSGDKRNVRIDHTGFAVGDPDFLDKSMARYWRTIEEGSAATWSRPFKSLELSGVWMAGRGSWTTFPTGRGIAGGGAPSKGGRQGKLLFMRYAKPPNRYPIFHPTREIAPMHAYRDVGRNMSKDLRSGEYLKAYKNWLSAARNDALSPTPPWITNGGMWR